MRELTNRRPWSAPTLLVSTLLVTLLTTGHINAAPAERFADVKVTAQHVSGSVHMLVGAGGNIGASIGADGTLIIDDQFAELGERILNALDKLGGDAPKLILNTHYHGDHTGANPLLGRTGTIMAHDNVRVRLLAQDNYPRSGLPLVTFADSVNVHFNDEQIHVIHLPHGHTDGDSVVWFVSANVIHMGDHFFNGRFPYIDIEGGGSVDGYVANMERVLGMVPADVRIIPGHGPLASVVDLADNLQTIKQAIAEVRAALAEGRSAEEIATTTIGDRYGTYGSGFISNERWVQIIAADQAGPSTTQPRR